MYRFVVPKRLSRIHVNSRRYLAALNDYHNEKSPESLCASRDRTICEILESSEPMNAFPLISQYKEEGKTIPANIMTRLYDVLKVSNNPFYTHLFASLTRVDHVGSSQFLPNVERVIKLYVAQRNWELCLAFIREVELANSGEILLSYETLESILLSAKWFNDSEICIQVVQVISSAYPNVYARTWGLVTQLVLDMKDYTSLKWIYKNALIPGHLVLDDASYLRMASIASENGDLHMCEWSSLRMRRRQRALQTSDTNSMQLYIYLIEAAARSSASHTEDKLAASFQAVCRYLVRLGPLAGWVSVRDLPQTINALVESPTNFQMLYDMFQNMQTDLAVSTEAKVFVFNLILYAELARGSPPEAVLDIAYSVRKAGIEFNEDSILCLIELAIKGDADQEAIQVLARQSPTSRVLKKIKALTHKNELTDQ